MEKLLSEDEKNLARAVAKLSGSLLQVIPADAEKKKEILELIAEESAVIAATASQPSEKPLKAISDNLTDTLHAIHKVLPVATEESKRRAQDRFKRAISVLNGLLDMVGL